MIQNNEYKKKCRRKQEKRGRDEGALKKIIRLMEGWVDSDGRKAEPTMLKILNTALEVV